MALAWRSPVALELPASSRPPLPDVLPLTGWVLESSVDGVSTWRAGLPIRTRALFTLSPAEGMQVHGPDGSAVPFRRRGGGAPSWRWSTLDLTLELPEGASPEGYGLRYPKALERERALNRAWSKAKSDVDFTRTSVFIDNTTHSGVLLPAPGAITWELSVPEAADLRFDAALVAPEVATGERSDGASLRVELEAAGTTHALRTLSLAEDALRSERIDLSPWAGQQVRLSLRSEPGATALLDYVFVSEPVVASRAAKPKRVVLVFIDTLRQDHLGLYGYERPTTPNLDAWSEGAAVFEQARSVAPWTLPTARTLLTGRQPEAFDDAATLPGAFAAEGWATAMFAGNVYLGANFDIDRDWGTHRATNWPPAADQVDTALSWLAQQEGRDAFLLLHFMDAHLPYEEPEPFRHRFAGDAVEPLGETFHRSQAARANTPEQRAYVGDRYDNNIAYIDHELGRFLGQLPEDATVMILSDHGEELWDHGGFEHGHALWDELLHVPLLLRSPTARPGRYEQPVSLLDVAPTLLRQGGIALPDGLDGLPLDHLWTEGCTKCRESFEHRDLAFGRPLYGRSRWGVLHDGKKYSTHEGEEQLFDLEADPGERVDLLALEDASAGEPWRERLGGALGRPAAMGYRLQLGSSRTPLSEPVSVTVSVPGGVAGVWAGEDPLQRSEATVALEEDELRITWAAGSTNERETFFAPKRPLDELTHELAFQVQTGARSTVLCVPPSASAAPRRGDETLLQTAVAGRQLTVSWGVFPFDDGAYEALDATDAENRDALIALGYVEAHAPDTPAPSDSSFASPCHRP